MNVGVIGSPRATEMLGAGGVEALGSQCLKESLGDLIANADMKSVAWHKATMRIRSSGEHVEVVIRVLQVDPTSHLAMIMMADEVELMWDHFECLEQWALERQGGEHVSD